MIPKAIARFLAPPVTSRDTEDRTFEEERAYLRSLEHQRRRALTRRILPDPRAVGALPVDLFGDPLLSGSDNAGAEGSTVQHKCTKAAETQAQC